MLAMSRWTARCILPVNRSRRRASATVFRFTPSRAAVLRCPSRSTSHSTTHLRSGRFRMLLAFGASMTRLLTQLPDYDAAWPAAPEKTHATTVVRVCGSDRVISLSLYPYVSS